MRALCIANCATQPRLIQVPWRKLLGTNNAARDLVSGARLSVHGPSLELDPYEVRWMTV
jgi:hypothetical protein